MAQGRFVCLATPGLANPAPGIFENHYYALLNYDQGSGQYLLYNPWGENGHVAVLPAGISKTTLTIQVETNPGGTSQTAAAIGIGDIIQIDGELMLVKTAVKDTKDAYYTLTVRRGYDNTKANSHLTNEYGGPTEIYLGMARNSGWSQLIASPNWSLFTENASFLDNSGQFSGMSPDHLRRAGTDSAAAALPTSQHAHWRARGGQRVDRFSWSRPQRRRFTRGAPATRSDPSQWESVQAAAAPIPVNRLKALDAVFAAGDFADEDRGTVSQSGSRSSDDADALFLPDEPAWWGVKLPKLRTSPE